MRLSKDNYTQWKKVYCMLIHGSLDSLSNRKLALHGTTELQGDRGEEPAWESVVGVDQTFR